MPSSSITVMHIMRIVILFVILLRFRCANSACCKNNAIRINSNRESALTTVWRKKSNLDDYILYENSLYKYHKGPSVWSKARDICEAEGAHLAIVNSEDESLFLRGMAKVHQRKNPKLGNGQIWLGFHDLFRNRHYVTIEDKLLDSTGYVSWGGAEPIHLPQSDCHCGSLMGNGGLGVVSCNRLLPFVCEKQLFNSADEDLADLIEPVKIVEDAELDPLDYVDTNAQMDFRKSYHHQPNGHPMLNFY